MLSCSTKSGWSEYFTVDEPTEGNGILDVNVDCRDLISQLRYLAPNSCDAWLDSPYEEQQAFFDWQGTYTLSAGAPPERQVTCAQRVFDLDSSEGTAACILACDVVNALLSRRISRLDYTDPGMQTKTTSFYVTQVLGLISKLSRKGSQDSYVRT